ncbi:uncharacterized protein [Antennarius striatus]|uniref:uncharacterized protein n=1 Tax=Antennarius striatus TaxID=241820 RepID=UPI0035AE3954
MDTLSSCFVEETNYVRREKEGVEEEEGDGKKEVKQKEKDESTPQKQQKTGLGPGLGFFGRMDKEVYYYVGKEIVIEEGFDSYAGMIWPAALALSHYLDTHRGRFNLVDKAVLEIGAGTGLLSIVAALLGAWVTATDLPSVLSNLRVNLSRNTRGHCRHTPQVAALSWGHDLESTYPTSVYHYDYVLAADVVYHHDFLEELLDTMKHFCKTGTTLIWANKIRFETDVAFTEKFKKDFHWSLLVEDGEMKIFMATCREEEEQEAGGKGMEMEDVLRKEEGKIEEAGDGENDEKCVEETLNDFELQDINKEKCKDKENNSNISEVPRTSETNRREDEEEWNSEPVKKEDTEQKLPLNVKDSKEEKGPGQSKQEERIPPWVPIISRGLNEDIYHFAGQNIVIRESIDSFGAVMWPAALALCSYLDKHREMNMEGKEVLELGAGTGLVTIVASLLGASVTATDLPEVMSNLRANVMRNTSGRCKHTPQVATLSWGHDLESTYPTSVYHYDYVLAADVVYHHDFLEELLDTMKHFCKPGTTLIWANKVRFETDVTFTEKFKKTFHTSLLAEDCEMKIFMGTCRVTDKHTDDCVF